MNKNDPAFRLAESSSAKLHSLVGQERTVLVEFLQHLEEFDRKKLYETLGFPSLFAYCIEGLRLSNGSAFRRLTAARLLRRFPTIAAFLADGRLNLSRLHLLREVLTEENHLDLLERATHGTERDVELIAATLKPKPTVADAIRKLPTPTQPRPAAASTSNLEVAVGQRTDALEAARDLAPVTSSLEVAVQPRTVQAPESAPLTSILEVPPVARREPRMEVHPTSATAWSVKMSVSREFIDEFEQVKAALSHKFPNGNFEDVLRECFRVTLEAVERRRSGSPRKSTPENKPTNAPRAEAVCGTQASATTHSVESASPSAPLAEELCGTQSGPKKPPRYIPAAVRRAVWKRDEGCCAFVSADGKRCGSRHQVELHHVEPFATGGPATEANLSVRCRAHNHFEAVLVFGAEFMDARIGEQRASGRNSLPDWKCPTQ